MEINDLIREYATDVCDMMEHENNFKETEVEILIRCQKIKELLKSLPHNIIGLICHSDLIFYLTSYIAEDGERYGKWLDNTEYIILSEPFILIY